MRRSLRRNREPPLKLPTEKPREVGLWGGVPFGDAGELVGWISVHYAGREPRAIRGTGLAPPRLRHTGFGDGL